MPAIASGISRLINNLKDGAKGVLPLIILAIYTIVGALIFREIEGPYEEFKLNNTMEDREKRIENATLYLNDIRHMRPLVARNHTEKVINELLSGLGNKKEIEPKWTFFGSIFYCMCVYTTIGYGDIVPETTAGRTLTILYAFIGIPLAVISLFALGQLFAKLCKFIWKLFAKSTRVVSKDLERKVTDVVGMDAEGEQKVKTQKQQQESGNDDDDNDLLNFPIGLLVVITILWILLCAAIFAFIEDWEYGKSLYFTLISFTTIGFGDVLPSKYDYMILVGILLLIGLSLVSTVMSLIQQQIDALANGVQANIDKEYMNALAEAADEGELTASMIEQVEVDEKGTPVNKPNKADGRSLDAIVSRMPLKERLLYHVMPASSKKRLQKHSEGRQNRVNKAAQTDNELLEVLLREELLKMELNNELDRLRPGPGGARIVSTGVREKMVPVEITRQYEPQNLSQRDDSPRPHITTHTVREDEV